MFIAASLAGGLVALIIGAQLLVRGASRLALSLGISPLVIGLTVVAFGTSSPELAVSMQGAWSGQADLALGNVVGSNIFNVLLILGVSALMTPLVVAGQVLRQEVPVMIGASLLLFACALDGSIGRLEGGLFTAGLVGYTGFLIVQSRRAHRASSPAPGATGTGWDARLPGQVAFVVAGLLLLVLGSNWLVSGAVALATRLGVSELVIGLTIVAAGTSLPEVATSLLAAARGERDIAVGNVVGSNIFNILGVLGASALLSPAPLTVAPAMLGFNLPVMLAVAVACLPVFYTGKVMSRWEGALFLGCYVAYITFLVLDAQGHGMLDTYTATLYRVLLPMAALALAVSVARDLRGRRSR